MNTGPISVYLRLSPPISIGLRLSPPISGYPPAISAYISVDLAFAPPMLSSVMGGPQMPGSSIEARMHCADLGELGE